jgi:hypothetical protein
MRLSCLVVASILSVSASLVAQHSSGTASSTSFSGSSSSGASHFSGSPGSSVNFADSRNSSASHVDSTGAAASSASKSTKLSSKKEKSIESPARCGKEPCPVCPSGEFRGIGGACVAARNHPDCAVLAGRLREYEKEMRGVVYSGQDLIHRFLLEQYLNCSTTGVYAFNRTRIADTMP